MKIAFDIIMTSDERETIENFIHCLDDYCRAINDCTKCKFGKFLPSNGSCPIGDDWTYHLIKED